MYLAIPLTEKSRQKLLSVFAPKFSIVVAHHITLCGPKTFGTSIGMPQSVVDEYLSRENTIEVIGYATDESLETVTVRINGSTLAQHGGRPLHITLSHEPTRKPVESSFVILANDHQYLKSPLLLDANCAKIFH